MAYTGIVLSSKQVQLIEPYFDDDPMITADSVICTLIGSDSATLSNVAMQYDDDLPVSKTWGWYANLNMPSSVQVVKIRVEALRSGVRGRWNERITIKPF